MATSKWMTEKKRLKAVVLTLGVFVGTLLVLWALPLTPIPQWQHVLYWNYASHVVFIAIPLLAIAALRRRPADYGLTTKAWRKEVTVGGICLVALVLAPLAGEALFGHLVLKHKSAVFVCSTILFQLLFSGFGEEVLFRGFFQGELDRAFGKPYRWQRVEFGWGLVIVSALFAVGHLLNPFNPFIGQYELDFTGLVLTGVAGLILGFVRAYFGSIIAASIIHGGWDLIADIFRLGAAGNIAMGVGLFVVCWYLATVFLEPLPNCVRSTVTGSAPDGRD